MSKWVHIIGICGVATAGVAVMFKKMGWDVTGSDKGFFPPVSEYLQMNGINILPGFKDERLTKNNSHPDLVVIQGTKGEANPEIKAARELHLVIKLYPEILQEYVVVPHGSIVVTGSFGKSTTTAALVYIFQQTSKSISYMYGALTSDFSVNIKAKNETTDYSIVEGDEYIASFTNNVSKFFFYAPKYLLLTGLSWDHPDVFKTETEYLNNFKKLVSMIPADGFIVANGDDEKVRKLLLEVTVPVIYYSMLNTRPGEFSHWYYLKESQPLPSFVKHEHNQADIEIIPFEKQVVGQFNIQNLLAAAVMASKLGIKKEDIQAGIKSFSGLKRRLEVRYQHLNSYIIDDFGSAPAKAKTSLDSLRQEFPAHKVIAIFEPTAGNRDPKALTQYQETFKKSDLVILPKFTPLPQSSQFVRFDEKTLSEQLSAYQVKNMIINNDTDLLSFLENEFKIGSKVIIIFLGSHSFRGMITSLVSSLKS